MSYNKKRQGLMKSTYLRESQGYYKKCPNGKMEDDDIQYTSYG